MDTRQLAFGGVICALASMCIILSSLFHLIFPLAISCALYCICEVKSGKACAIIVIFTSNITGFMIGGIGSGEILFSVLLFSPFAAIIFCTSGLKKKFWQVLVRAVLFAAFSIAVYVLFVTVLKNIVGIGEGIGGMPIGAALGAIFAVVMTAFGFALDGFTAFLARRFIKND